MRCVPSAYGLGKYGNLFRIIDRYGLLFPFLPKDDILIAENRPVSG